MTLDSQLKITAGTIYGRMMEVSGISLRYGGYISRAGLASELMDNGVQANRRELLRNIRQTLLIDYGSKDNILTGIQILKEVWRGHYEDPSTTITYNPWRELMGGSKIVGDPKFSIMRQNPQEGVRKLMEMYALFTQLPQELQNEFLELVGTYPCYLGSIMRNYLTDIPKNIRPIRPEIRDVTSRIIQVTAQNHQREMKSVLRLLSRHNICVEKGTIVRKEIGELLEWDIERTPTEWKKGHLVSTIIADDVAELNEMLSGKNR